MTLKLYNTLTRDDEPEVFRPLDPSNVRMYVCGPTVYDFAHIGNARPVIVFDVLFRLLRLLYGPDHVTYVRNITDVDDKINARAAQDFSHLPLNEAIRKVTGITERQFHDDIKELNCLSAEQVNKPGKPKVFFEPRATEHIDDMKAMIERLVAKNCAYVAEDHVLFHVAAMPDYGALANRSPDEMMAGARVDVAPYKRDAMDFVLWKPSKPGEPAWPSPCGIATPGRPGWHIECSAMSWKLLSQKPFDIHGGGIDLVFPHHENELAQTRCAFGVERMAQVWMHNGFLQVEGRKMAKSEGNFVTINELLSTKNFGGKMWWGGALRIAMLRTHYRKPIDWTITALELAENRFMEWADLQKELQGSHQVTEDDIVKEDLDPDFLAALLDDLNTHLALKRLYELGVNATADRDAARRFLTGLSLMGIPGWPLVSSEKRSERDALILQVNPLISARDAARKAKNYAEADRIRLRLEEMGFVVKDNADGITTLKLKR